MCGAVSYKAEVHQEISICHCGMCRQWCGGPLLAVGTDRIAWDGEDNMTVITSSAWAERAFCNKCGSSLFYRVTADGKHKGFTSLAFGTLDDQTGFEAKREFFIDKKPAVYEFAGERKKMTEAEVMAAFGGS